MESVEAAMAAQVANPEAEEVREVESGEDSSEEEEEIVEELDALKSDNVYYNFVSEVSAHGPLKGTNEEDPLDSDYIPESMPLEAAGDGIEGIKDGDEVEDEDESSSDSSVYEEAEENLEEVNHDTREDVPVPPEALKEAAVRFPPFWRTKNKMALENHPEYKSDEDSDFEPTEDDEEGNEMEEGPQGLLDPNVEVVDLVSSSSEDEENESDIEKDEMDNLVEMAEEQLAIHDEAGAAVLEIAPQPVAECLARSIVEFDPETYIEEQDPDYIPPENVAEIDSSSSSDDDDEEEGEVDDNDKMEM